MLSYLLSLQGSEQSDGEREGSQQSTSYAQEAESDEEEVLNRLRDIGVHDRRVPPQFQPLTAKQRSLYRNAMDVSFPAFFSLLFQDDGSWQLQ